MQWSTYFNAIMFLFSLRSFWVPVSNKILYVVLQCFFTSLFSEIIRLPLTTKAHPHVWAFNAVSRLQKALYRFLKSLHPVIGFRRNTWTEVEILWKARRASRALRDGSGTTTGRLTPTELVMKTVNKYRQQNTVTGLVVSRTLSTDHNGLQYFVF